MKGRLKVTVRLVRRVCMFGSPCSGWAAQGEGIKPLPAANLQSLVAAATTGRVSRSAAGGTAQTGPASDRTGMASCQVDVTLSPSPFWVVLRVSFLRTKVFLRPAIAPPRLSYAPAAGKKVRIQHPVRKRGK